jgi:hypothetical protein
MNANLIYYGLMAFGLLIGATVADVDLAPVFGLRHRSAWTHGAPFPVAFYFLARLNPLLWWFVVGLLPALTMHLLYDCFPKNWAGSANIKFAPLPWHLPGWASAFYIAAGAVASGWAWLALIAPSWRLW